jgi:hypothetical protein
MVIAGTSVSEVPEVIHEILEEAALAATALAARAVVIVIVIVIIVVIVVAVVAVFGRREAIELAAVEPDAAALAADVDLDAFTLLGSQVA